MRKLNIGIIGCGGISKSHINSYIGQIYRIKPSKKDTHENNASSSNTNGEYILNLKDPKANVVAICDLLEEKVEETYRFYAEQGYTIVHKFSGEDSYQQLLELDLDGISICVPPIPVKEKIILAALSRRKNILAEKPLSYDLESAKRIADAIADTFDEKSVSAMCYNWRNTFIMKKLREIINNYANGKLQHLSVIHVEPWNYFGESFYTNLGYLLEHNIHDINYLRFLNGEIREVEAVAYGGDGRLPKNPSSITINFTYENGTKGVFHSMNGTRESAFNITAVFEKGIIHGFKSDINPDFEWRDTPYYRLFGPDGREIYSEPYEPSSPNLPSKPNLSSKPILTPDGKISWITVNEQGVNGGLSHNQIINDFLEAVQYKKEPKSSVVDGYNDIKFISAITRSIQENKRVNVN
ncbi:Gfo/Idh/MocA family oxidoreductase [Candidatus Woesearchaeota archaeon]|nr:Gfo/Idh/MocA family oxidoreductase [Candidatus Woesearchaeota archaeon]